MQAEHRTSQAHEGQELAASPIAQSAAGEAQPFWLDRFAAWWSRHDDALYASFALGCTVYAASLFYGYMLWQTKGVWSAPLDDVFIHFDYARSWARGFPFQWSEGNGYSSGNTSLTYPALLAVGYWLGFRQLSLAIWAAAIAVLSIWLLLVGAGHAVRRQAGRHAAVGWARWLLPPAVLSMGALDWTLFSGMENALHLGLWGLCLAIALRLSSDPTPRKAWLLGLVGALLVATRPESAVTLATFGLFVAWCARRQRRPWRSLAALLLIIGLPALVTLLVHSAFNRAFTGEWSSNGSIAKLIINRPYASAGDKLSSYLDLWRYIVPRLTGHHFAESAWWGSLIPATGLLGLAHPRLRPLVVLLWAQVFSWMFAVALNGQLRWHNARYAMPAVAWLMLLAAIGVAVVATAGFSFRKRRSRLAGPLGITAAILIATTYWHNQAPRMKDQIWFFGRACRNILDQHVTAGLVLKKLRPKRILVGDAGALTYISDRPGLDIIGLGGYHGYPFARATVQGLGASLELIEHMPVSQRPDMMAIYPSWWGDLPTYFGRYLDAIPVVGNVICGGAEKVLYQADWTTMDRRGMPLSIEAGEHIVDQLDIADLINERSHAYSLPRPKIGFVKYRVLGEPVDQGQRDLFDAGRIVPRDHRTSAIMRAPTGPARLVMRFAPDAPLTSDIAIDGTHLTTVTAEVGGGQWLELSVPLPDSLEGHFELALTPRKGTATYYHVWVLGR